MQHYEKERLAESVRSAHRDAEDALSVAEDGGDATSTVAALLNILVPMLASAAALADAIETEDFG